MPSVRVLLLIKDGFNNLLGSCVKSNKKATFLSYKILQMLIILMKVITYYVIIVIRANIIYTVKVLHRLGVFMASETLYYLGISIETVKNIETHFFHLFSTESKFLICCWWFYIKRTLTFKTEHCPTN